MSDEALPKGPCPDEEKLNTVVAKIINVEGAQNLTFKALRIRVESELKISMEEHRPAIEKAAEKAVRAPRTLKKLQEYDEERKNGTLVSTGQGKAKGGKGVKKSKKGSSSTKRASSSSRVKKEKYEGPKKPQSAYFLFIAEKRPELTAQGLGLTDIAKKGGELWGQLTDEEKGVYEAKKEEDAKRYEKECAEYVANGGVIKGGARATKVKKEKKDGPKKPLSAYFCFLAEKRPELTAQGLGLTDIAKKGGELWGQLTDEEKAPYEAKKQEDVKRYERECEALGIDPKAKSSKPKKAKKATRGKRNRSSKKNDDSSVSSFSSSDSSDSDSSSGSDSDSSSSLSSDSSSISSDSSDTAE